jgi:peptide/nickel transport system substrate-binding protein
MIRRFLVVASILVTFLVLVACGAAAPEPAPAPQPGQPAPPAQMQATPAPATQPAPPASAPAGTPVRGGVAINWAPDDSGIGIPILSKANPEYRFQYSDSLVLFDNYGNLQPALAESWELANNNQTLTFQLRDDVKWHDGTPFTAHDVVFTLDKVGDPTTATTLKGLLTVGGEYVTYSASDDHTVVVNTSVPFAPILAAFHEMLIIAQHQLKDSADINADPANTSPQGTGAFKVVEWERNSSIRTERNPDYFMGEPHLDGITHVFIADRDTADAAMLSGQLDAMHAVPQQQPQFEEPGSGAKVHLYPFWQAITVAFNQAHPALKEKAVRQAISMSIASKEEWGNAVLRGRGMPAEFGFWTPGAPVAKFNPPQSEIPPHVFDLEGAKALLDQAGWTVGSDGIREKMIDGQLERLELGLPWELTEYGEGTQILDRYVQPLGIKLNIRKVDRALRNDLRSEAPTRFRERSLEIYEWPHSGGGQPIGAYEPDLMSDVHSKNIPPGGSNFESYSNPEVDALLDQGIATFDEAERQRIYSQIQLILLEDYAAIPLYHAFDALVVSDRLKGLQDDTPFAREYWRRFSHKFWLEE